MARVLVTEKIAASGLDVLRAEGHDVDEQLGLSPEALLDAIKGAHALIVTGYRNRMPSTSSSDRSRFSIWPRAVDGNMVASA